MAMDNPTYQLLLAASVVILIIWMVRRRESFDEIDVDESTSPYEVGAPIPFANLTEQDLLNEENAFLENRKKLNQSFADGSMLMPEDASPNAPDLTKANFLTAGYHIGLDSRPQTKVKNLDIRSLPAIPRSSTDNPWFNETSYDADLPKKRLE